MPSMDFGDTSRSWFPAATLSTSLQSPLQVPSVYFVINLSVLYKFLCVFNSNHNNSYLSSMFYVLGTLRSTLHALSYSVFPMTLWDGYYFIEEEIERWEVELFVQGHTISMWWSPVSNRSLTLELPCWPGSRPSCAQALSPECLTLIWGAAYLNLNSKMDLSPKIFSLVSFPDFRNDTSAHQIG